MEKRKRHWFLLIVLVFLAISIIFSTIDILIYSSNYKAININVTDSIILLHTFSTIIELYLLYLVFKWKKIGFNGLLPLYLFLNLYIPCFHASRRYGNLAALDEAATDGKPDINLDTLVKQLQQKLQPKEYRKRFLVKHAQKLVSVEIDEIAYFYSDGRLNFFKTSDNKKYVVDYTMDELEEMLDPEKYFRISRSFYVSVGSIEKIDDYFGNRLILQLKPAVDKEALVSREKVTEFKKWMGK